MAWYLYEPRKRPLYDASPRTPGDYGVVLVYFCFALAAAVLICMMAALLIFGGWSGASVISMWVAYFMFRSAWR